MGTEELSPSTLLFHGGPGEPRPGHRDLRAFRPLAPYCPPPRPLVLPHMGPLAAPPPCGGPRLSAPSPDACPSFLKLLWPPPRPGLTRSAEPAMAMAKPAHSGPGTHDWGPGSAAWGLGPRPGLRVRPWWACVHAHACPHGAEHGCGHSRLVRRTLPQTTGMGSSLHMAQVILARDPPFPQAGPRSRRVLTHGSDKQSS